MIRKLKRKIIRAIAKVFGVPVYFGPDPFHTGTNIRVEERFEVVELKKRIMIDESDMRMLAFPSSIVISHYIQDIQQAILQEVVDSGLMQVYEVMNDPEYRGRFMVGELKVLKLKPRSK